MVNGTVVLDTSQQFVWPGDPSGQDAIRLGWLTQRKAAAKLKPSARMTMTHAQEQVVTIGVTGASGAILAQKVLQLLHADARVSRVHLVITETGQRLLAEELGISASDLKQLPSRILAHSGTESSSARPRDPLSTSQSQESKIDILSNTNLGESIASGSYQVDSMIVIPCSMATLASVANGISDDLVTRAADVMLKEGRRLVLCIRDTPFSRIHLENMLRAQQAGAVIMPAILSYYHQPKTIDDLVTQYVCRVLSQIGLTQERMYRWMGKPASRQAKA